MTQAAATPAIPTPRPTPITGVYKVPSKTYPGARYETDIRDRAHPTCTCMAGQNNFENCKRVDACWHVRACVARQDAALSRWARLRARHRPRGMDALRDAFF